MSQETLSTAAALGTFVVIAATAIAAVVQLRHMRSGNQIATFAHIEALADSQEVAASGAFVNTELPARMKDHSFRQALAGPRVGEVARPILPIINFCEQTGTLVKHGYIDRDFVLDTHGRLILGYWRRLSPVMPILRRAQGDAVGVNFEYIAALSQKFMESGLAEMYPRGVPRMPVDTTWLDETAPPTAS